MDASLKLPLHSNVSNAINYILFDLAFAITIHILTSDIAGLSNCNTVIHFDKKEIDARKAPFVGSGITCTKRNVFYTVAALRFTSWILVFATTFLLEGTSSPTIFEKTTPVVSKGNASSFYGAENLIAMVMKRVGCQGRTKNSSYYGEIRNGECELDLDLLSKPVVHFGLKYEDMKVTTNSCASKNYNWTDYSCPEALTIICLEYESKTNVDECAVLDEIPKRNCEKTGTTNEGKTTFSCMPLSSTPEIVNGSQSMQHTCKKKLIFPKSSKHCENASVGCFGTDKCGGIVLLKGETFVCKEMKPTDADQIVPCKKVRGIDWKIGNNVQLFGTAAAVTMENVLAIMYAAGVEERLIRAKHPKKRDSATVVSPFWFAILSVKVLLVVILLAVVIRFRFLQGLCRVANDENGIMYLLKSTISGTAGRSRPVESSTINETQVYVSLVSDEPRLTNEESA